MSKLLARAKVKRSNAEDNYLKIGQDDAYLDETCYNLQQAIEFSLKYLVEMNGENFVESHDVFAQLNKLKELNAVIPMENKIARLAATLDSWETETKNNDDFTAEIEDVEDAREIALELISYCDGLVEEL